MTFVERAIDRSLLLCTGFLGAGLGWVYWHYTGEWGGLILLVCLSISGYADIKIKKYSCPTDPPVSA